jgi:hypothetical protein
MLLFIIMLLSKMFLSLMMFLVFMVLLQIRITTGGRRTGIDAATATKGWHGRGSSWWDKNK